MSKSRSGGRAACRIHLFRHGQTAMNVENRFRGVRDVPLSEIALATGFADQAHFSNKFRRMAGTTPTQWRRTHT